MVTQELDKQVSAESLKEYATKLAAVPQLMIQPEWTDRDDQITLRISPDILPYGQFKYESLEQAAGSPLAKAILNIKGLSSVHFVPKKITLGLDIKDEENRWTAPNVAIDAIREHIKAAKLIVEAEEFAKLPAPKKMSDEDKKRLSEGITELFEKEINPMLASHGGFVTLVNLDNFVAFVTVGGGCHGCHSVPATMKQGIEVRVKEVYPDIVEVVDTTDHSTGENPYF